ncbi:MAG: hypothetical protein JSV16_05685 [Candidatus Hydrogenedentota bacterium]|nr:MAG: hypothetical protein JSV16_05685 [Candidatus Hydrogenedentota bacterium]
MRQSRVKGTLSKIIGVLGVLLVALFLFDRVERPSYPFVYEDPSKSDPAALIDREALLKDIDYLVALIDESHPDPYNFISKSDFQTRADQMKDHILAFSPDSIQRIDCYYYLQKLVAALQDEHTAFKFQDEWLKNYPKRFPLELRVTGGRVFIEDTRNEYGIPQNTELLAINDRPVSWLLSEFIPLVNETLLHYKYQIIEENFDRLLQTYADMTPPWRIIYRHDEHECSAEILGIARDKPTPGANAGDLYTESILEVDEKTVPILEIPRFYYPDKAAYEAFIDGFFRRHYDKEYLVIDLRRNPGGDGRWAFFVLDYLTDKPYLLYKRFDFKISQTFVAATRYFQHKEYYNKGIPRVLWRFAAPWVRDDYWWDKINQVSVGEYAEDHDASRIPDSDKTKFRGKVLLLISHRTNSAAVVFSAIFKHNNLGVVLGRETGGRIGFTSDPIPIEMPYSHLKMSLPVAILELPGDNTNRGVIPDFHVPKGIEGSHYGVDVDLEKVKELIRE